MTKASQLCSLFSGHSLNLVGNSAAGCCLQAIIFLILFNASTTFFSASTHRWQVLLSFVGKGKKIVKQLSGTRWSARADAVTCLHESYYEIKKALESLIMNRSQTKETQNNAQNLTKKMNSFEIVFLTILWKDILCHFNETSKTLQKESLNLDVAVRILKSLLHFIKDLRSQFQEYEKKAIMMLPLMQH